mmetsp:Transcript_4261/g.13168  ORF Transcript_4261/g.13168 Transcript_4261/m.13168 type:complete len:208 (-) Transcript_4261:448-1071(-)
MTVAQPHRRGKERARTPHVRSIKPAAPKGRGLGQHVRAELVGVPRVVVTKVAHPAAQPPSMLCPQRVRCVAIGWLERVARMAELVLQRALGTAHVRDHDGRAAGIAPPREEARFGRRRACSCAGGSRRPVVRRNVRDCSERRLYRCGARRAVMRRNGCGLHVGPAFELGERCIVQIVPDVAARREGALRCDADEAGGLERAMHRMLE